MRFTLIFLFTFSTFLLSAQTKTTEALTKKYDGEIFTAFFYRSTLQMLNQNDDKDFDELVKDIEKMRFMMLDKAKLHLDGNQYKNLKTQYRSEGYEEMMSGRFEGRNFDIYLREQNGNVKGTVILLNDSTNLMILDILGKIALDKTSQLFKTIDGSTEIGNRIKAFTGNGDKDKKKDDHGID
ncbi:MAG: DUF4252 domain-containing protein [Cyclobacteriaceae bacterium]|nr:DUF4252 domain-containing protein [Cyclobacteriaceae bacterium]